MKTTRWLYSHPSAEGRLPFTIDLFLYGKLARYAKEPTGYGFANLKLSVKDNATMADILDLLKIPTEERGITFINGSLSAMPGLQPDLTHVLKNGDRVAFFDLISMWPFQYRHGAMMVDELAKALSGPEGKGLHHSYGPEQG